MVEDNVLMVGLVVLVMLWDKYLRHRIEMTKLKQEKTIAIKGDSLTEEDVVALIESNNKEAEEPPKLIKI
jgi:ubiquinone biosynthesis protein UbiJ|tara:strand:+ start:81 stop:290 length:210 start_codon:yes stop_codon:yes gene_type:complete